MHAQFFTEPAPAFEVVEKALSLGWQDNLALNLRAKGLDAILSEESGEDEFLLLLTADDAAAWVGRQ